MSADIAAILDLARSMEPASTLAPTFRLESDREGRWSAEVRMKVYFARSRDEGHDSPESAMEDLRRQMLSLNQSAVRRMMDALKRWTRGTPTLRAIDGGRE